MADTLTLGTGDEATYLLLALSQITDTLRDAGGLSTTPVQVATVSLLDQANAMTTGTARINFTG